MDCPTCRAARCLAVRLSGDLARILFILAVLPAWIMLPSPSHPPVYPSMVALREWVLPRRKLLAILLCTISALAVGMLDPVALLSARDPHPPSPAMARALSYEIFMLGVQLEIVAVAMAWLVVRKSAKGEVIAFLRSIVADVWRNLAAWGHALFADVLDKEKAPGQRLLYGVLTLLTLPVQLAVAAPKGPEHPEADEDRFIGPAIDKLMDWQRRHRHVVSSVVTVVTFVGVALLSQTASPNLAGSSRPLFECFVWFFQPLVLWTVLLALWLAGAGLMALVRITRQRWRGHLANCGCRQAP